MLTDARGEPNVGKFHAAWTENSINHTKEMGERGSWVNKEKLVGRMNWGGVKTEEYEDEETYYEEREENEERKI